MGRGEEGWGGLAGSEHTCSTCVPILQREGFFSSTPEDDANHLTTMTKKTINEKPTTETLNAFEVVSGRE